MLERTDPTVPDSNGLIWITGFSASGKTTVGRKVEQTLRSLKVPVIFLDGDDLRSIFGFQHGYERQQRIDLAKIYFRLCSHLVSQGYTVVISAVAMYQDLIKWVSDNFSKHLIVYLDVPEQERRSRDRDTKKIYGKIDLSKTYDENIDFELTLNNSGSESPEQNSERIVAAFLSKSRHARNMGRAEHWAEYYKSNSTPLAPSLFARHVAENLDGDTRLIEIGCGNGRDSFYFESTGCDVTALDISSSAIDLCRSQNPSTSVQFMAGNIYDLRNSIAKDLDVAYCRFVLHAMPLEEEVAVISGTHHLLKDDGLFYIECRSINDPMANVGEVISPTERYNGHYRRFIILDELCQRLIDGGFDIVTAEESRGLAVFGDDDPMVIRVCAKKTRRR